MRKLALTTSLLASAAAFSPAFAAETEPCTRNLVGFDVCAQAQKIAAETKSEIEGKRWGRGTIDRLDAEGATLTYSATWRIPAPEHAKSVDGNGALVDPLKAQVEKAVLTAVCGDPRAAAMARLGAAYEYRLSLPDKRPLHTITIRDCPQ